MATSSSKEGLNTSYFDHFVCNICFDVLREPVQCARNQHYFCKSCITEHLTHSQTCPVCQDHLTSRTLRPISRFVANLLRQFQSPKCRYANRGCTASVRHEVLLSHHEECGFAPVQCSNDGCAETVNRQDLASHERESCGFRPVACEECKQRMSQREYVRHPCVFRKEIDKNKFGLGEVERILREIQEEQHRQGEQIQRLFTKEETKTQPKEASRPQGTEGLQNKQVLWPRTAVRGLNVPTQQKQSSAMKEQQGNPTNDRASISQLFSSRVQTQAIEDKQIFVAGGDCDYSSCEIFNWSTQKWSSCEDILFFDHSNGFSFVYDNKVVLCGGTDTNRIECVSVSSDISSNALPLLLPEDCGKGALYGDTIVTVGESVSETSLKPPYKSTAICSVGEGALPFHAVAYVENCGMVVVVGWPRFFAPFMRRTGFLRDSNVERRDVVLLYNPTTKKIRKLAPLPYEVGDMAVLAYNDNVIILGGETKDGVSLNDVLMYNIRSQQCSKLPKMLEKRSRFAAVMMGNTIVVMGGISCEYDNNSFRKVPKTLETAEYLVLGEKTWKKLPPMTCARDGPTACVVP